MPWLSHPGGGGGAGNAGNTSGSGGGSGGGGSSGSGSGSGSGPTQVASANIGDEGASPASGTVGGEQNPASAENRKSGRIGSGRGAAGSGDAGGGFGAGNLSLLAIILLLLAHWFSKRMKRATIRHQQAADSRADNRQAALARRMSFDRAG